MESGASTQPKLFFPPSAEREAKGGGEKRSHSDKKQSNVNVGQKKGEPPLAEGHFFLLRI